MDDSVNYILYIAVSLDGLIARADGSIDWLASSEESIEDYGYTEFYNSIDALVTGSTTYKQILGFGNWPYPGKLTYVLTRHHLSSDRNDVMFLPSLAALLTDVEQKGFRRVWVVGGGQVAAQFMRQRLIDEYILTLIPVILGDGISLYQAVPEQKLTLIEAKSYGSGVVELRYRRV